MNKIIQCYFDADLRCGHDGLSKLAKKDKILVGDLLPGNFVIFINSKRNKLKLYAANHVVAYLRLEQGRYLDLNIIRAIPQAFNASGKLDYDGLLKNTIVEKLYRPKPSYLKDRVINNPSTKKDLNLHS